MNEAIKANVEAWIEAEIAYKVAVFASAKADFEDEALEDTAKKALDKAFAFRGATIALIDHQATGRADDIIRDIA